MTLQCAYGSILCIFIQKVTTMKHWGHLDINAQGHLMLGGCDALELAKEFGTPLYVMEEDVIRSVCRGYT